MHWIGAVSIDVLICVCDEVHGHASHSLLRGELSTKAVHTKNNLQWQEILDGTALPIVKVILSNHSQYSAQSNCITEAYIGDSYREKLIRYPGTLAKEPPLRNISPALLWAQFSNVRCWLPWNTRE